MHLTTFLWGRDTFLSCATMADSCDLWVMPVMEARCANGMGIALVIPEATMNQTLTTGHGLIPVAGPVERHPNGALMSCTPAGPVTLDTPVGPLEAQHSTDDLRRRTVGAVTFHVGGMLRCLSLEHAQTVVTPCGEMRAEMVTFHPDGALKRVFPLNGRLSGFWSQEDEAALAEPVEVETPVGPLRARVICLCFAPGGWLRSVALWPSETVDVPTPVGVFPARMGVAFGPLGEVQSLEPADPMDVPTPVGVVCAFDPDAVGISGDAGSLVFEDGRVRRLATVHTALAVRGANGEEVEYVPAWRESLCGLSDREPVPMRLSFAGDTVRIDRGQGPAVRVALGDVLAARPHAPTRGLTKLAMACGC